MAADGISGPSLKFFLTVTGLDIFPSTGFIASCVSLPSHNITSHSMEDEYWGLTSDRSAPIRCNAGRRLHWADRPTLRQESFFFFFHQIWWLIAFIEFLFCFLFCLSAASGSFMMKRMTFRRMIRNFCRVKPSVGKCARCGHWGWNYFYARPNGSFKVVYVLLKFKCLLIKHFK